jgi:hypothetical protein
VLNLHDLICSGYDRMPGSRPKNTTTSRGPTWFNCGLVQSASRACHLCDARKTLTRSNEHNLDQIMQIRIKKFTNDAGVFHSRLCRSHAASSRKFLVAQPLKS